MKKFLILFSLISSSLIFASGCSMPQMDVKAEEGRPASAEIEMVSIPYNPNLPKYIFIVEPFSTSQKVVAFTQGEAGQVPIGDKMAAQLITALSKVGNFVLYDHRAASRVKVGKGEKGPYLIKATLTEFNETAEAASTENSFSLGGIGAVLGIAGAIADKPGLMWTGAGLAVANPGVENAEAMKRGMVAFDTQITDKKSGRIIASFESAGTFKAQSAVNGFSLFGFSNRRTQFASSVLGQALRLAMNDAVKKTYDNVR